MMCSSAEGRWRSGKRLIRDVAAFVHVVIGQQPGAISLGTNTH
jgi:hypothetical protein